MMRRNVEMPVPARICQVASLLVILGMVLGMLAHDVVRGPGGTAQPQATGFVVTP